MRGGVGSVERVEIMRTLRPKCHDRNLNSFPARSGSCLKMLPDRPSGPCPFWERCFTSRLGRERVTGATVRARVLARLTNHRSGPVRRERQLRMMQFFEHMRAATNIIDTIRQEQVSCRTCSRLSPAGRAESRRDPGVASGARSREGYRRRIYRPWRPA